MTGAVVRLARTCEACKHGFHDRCHQFLGELFGFGHLACPCFPSCRDEHGELSATALREMMARHPDAVIRRLKVREAVERGSLPAHMRRRLEW